MSNRPVAKNRTPQPKHTGASKQSSKKPEGRVITGSSRTNVVPWVVGVVLVGVVVALLVALLSNGSDDVPTGSDASTVLAKLTSVPASVFESVGTGSAGNPPTQIADTPLLADGKPQIVYVGAEYCPYCAAQRWPTVLALSRFGSFSKISLSHSSTVDTFPNTQTFSFRGAEYQSDVISFSGTETASNQLVNGNYAPLDKPSPEVQQLIDQHTTGSIPFIDFGGKYILSGATYSPQVLQGKSADQIAAAMSDPSSEIAQGAVGSANLLTAAICAATDQKPANVCTTPAVQQAATKLGAAGS